MFPSTIALFSRVHHESVNSRIVPEVGAGSRRTGAVILGSRNVASNRKILRISLRFDRPEKHLMRALDSNGAPAAEYESLLPSDITVYRPENGPLVPRLVTELRSIHTLQFFHAVHRCCICMGLPSDVNDQAILSTSLPPGAMNDTDFLVPDERQVITTVLRNDPES